MPKNRVRKISLSFKIFSLMLLLLLVTLLLIGRFFYFKNEENLKEQIGRSLESIAVTTAFMIDGQQHQTIGYKKDFFSSEYIQIKNLLRNVKQLNKLDAPLYTLRRVDDTNEVEFIVSSDEVSSLLGARYELRKDMLPVFQQGISKHTDIYKDKSGTWISAYAPIKTRSGDVVGVLEVDYLVTGFLNKLRQETLLIISISILAAIAGLIFIFPLLSTITRSLKALEVAATELEKGNYDFRVNIKTTDEIGSFATTFEHLRLSLKDHITQLENAWIEEKKAHLESIKALSKAIEIKDPYTRGHLERVSLYSELLAKELGLSQKDVEKLRYGCILHDVGKIGIDFRIIQKPARLNETEYAEIKKHPAFGAQIIEDVDFLSQARDIILYHQEKYDGSGYPFGLKGEEIPFLARIVSVADVFDAMTTDRPYRNKLTDEETFDLIKKESGKHFDPKIVDAFLGLKDKILKIKNAS